MEDLLFDMPRGFDQERVAKTFSAYLLGPSIFDHGRTQHHRPFPVPKPSEVNNHWRLDPSGNYWLRFEPDGRVALCCRYHQGRAVGAAMVTLFLIQQGLQGPVARL